MQSTCTTAQCAPFDQNMPLAPLHRVGVQREATAAPSTQEVSLAHRSTQEVDGTHDARAQEAQRGVHGQVTRRGTPMQVTRWGNSG